MEIAFSNQAQLDLTFWKTSGNQAVIKKISQLLVSISETPFDGIGKPEALKYDLTGQWSRRINNEHRIVYEMFSDFIKIHSLLGHYNQT